MSRTLFKFTKPPEGTTRRVMFMEQPGWPVLSAKLESLYGISKGNVGVSYIDSDGDEVTLSSDDELRDFYKYNNPTKGFGHSGDAMKAIRFTVRDLSAMRAAEEDKPLPHPPLSSNHRNTFGLSGAFEGDEWQHISAFNGPPTSLFVPMIPEDSPAPHAYLEVVESDVSMSRRSAQDDASSVTQSDRSTPKADKGKRRATVSSEDDEDDHASIVAMVEEDVPHKPPVHVRNASFAGTEDTFGVRKTAPPAPAVERPDMEIVDDPEDATMEIPDPPLADLEDIPSASHSNASLANDIAGLLNSFSNVFAAHPELSDAMRNIVRNASDGSYWSAQRDAVSRAAEGLRRDAQRSAEDMRSAAEEMHRAAEEAAGRRVAEALGSVVRAFGQFTGVTGIPDTTSRVTDEPITSTPVHHRTPGHHGSRPSRRFRRGTGLPGTENENVHARPPPRPDSLGSIHDPMFAASHPHRHSTSSSSFGFGHGPFPFHIPPPPPPPPPMFAPPTYSYPPFFAPPPPPPAPPMEEFMNMFHTPPRPPTPPTPPTHPASPFMPPPPPPPRPPRMDGEWPPLFGPRSPATRPTVNIPIDTLDDGGLSSPSIPSSPEEAERILPDTSVHPADKSPSTQENAADQDPQAQQGASYIASKEALLKAKEMYKKEKERYRKEREQKRAAKARRANVSGQSSQPSGDETKRDATQNDVGMAGPSRSRYTPDPQVVSNARGTFPRIEIQTVSPRRYNTMHITGGWSSQPHQRHPHVGHPPLPRPPLPRIHNPFLPPSSNTPRSIQNVTQRLADMGFTADKHANLPAKVSAHVHRMNDITSREAEDKAVADVVEELLAEPQPGASASGANLSRSQTMPGGLM